MKKYLFLAASALALASCSSDDFIGTPGTQENGTSAAINFGGNAGNITRATSNTANTAAEKLDYQFKMYGVKQVVIGENTQYQKVFEDYSLWSADAKNTTTNTDGWEYVGEKDSKGHGNITLAKDQTIKYWDYSSKDYRFVAGSPIENFTFNTATDGDGSITSASVKGLAGHINANASGEAITTNPVYIAKPKVVSKNDYGKTVQFNFVRQQSKVRVGIYETIPGYSISEIKFYKQGESGFETTANSNNIILTSAKEKYFVGGTNATGTIEYNWTTTPASYKFKYGATGLTEAQNWYAGAMDGVKAVTSTETNVNNFYGTDNDREDNGYFTVIPTPSATNADAILIKCDYTLTSEDGSNETIKVTGATAAIPAAFCKWEPNVMYTYIFKISQNTNGYTGDNPEHSGLFPITFDAVVADFTEKEQGTITTVATPSITTYQVGSVTNDGVKYTTNKEIYAEVADNTNGEVKTLTDEVVKVYKLTTERNEADLQISGIIDTEIIDKNKVTDATVGSENATVGTVTLTASKYLKFTPEKTGWYAIQYKTSTTGGTDAYTYKVVHVE